MFELNERLITDTIEIGKMELSVLLLMNDRSLPWLILVPRRDGTKEIHELPPGDRSLLIEEISVVSDAIARLFNPDKINVGALGNLVPQLHVHVIGRFRGDRAWPGPIWGTGPSEPYNRDERDEATQKIRKALGMRIG